ncbi:MAG: class I adenylate-forming enzyme family protein [Streptomycetales bacterium]
MGIYAKRPWLSLYQPGKPADIVPEFADAVSMWRASVDRSAGQPLVHYFHTTHTVAEIDQHSDALAVAIAERGVGAGDRVALYLQNVPQFVIAMLAVWKLGAIVVPVNPMLKQRELRYLLDDSGAKALISLRQLWHEVAAEVVGSTAVSVVVTTSALDYLDPPVPALLATTDNAEASQTADFAALVRDHPDRQPDPPTLNADDTAMLTYTSGTTGDPKGAMSTHGNVTFNAAVYREWMSLSPADVILAGAPLFHITGLIGHVAVALLVPMPMALSYRFDPATINEMVERHGCTFTVMAITAFTAMMNDPSIRERKLHSLRKCYSGGAPIAPNIVERFEREAGCYINNIYGLTETNSPSHAVPMGRRAPVDPTSGALSIGVPLFNNAVRIVDENGVDLPPGEVGEIATRGPEVVPGYWNKPEATAHTLRDGELRTGDVGFMDDEGWFYVVDRKKDMINAAGYKVWPREVEDVLVEHPAVREAAVIGVPDTYRVETVKAFVSLRPGGQANAKELIAFCKERMAAYKYPRHVEILDDLPKTPTGKLLRRELRERARSHERPTSQ